MPYAPKRPCNHPGCGELVDRGYCAAHRKAATKQYVEVRGSSWKRGYDAAWEKVRGRALKRDGYLCQHCLQKGLLVPAKHVDHIVPFVGRKDPLRLDLKNLQSLCVPCHSIKTMTEDQQVKRF